MAIEFRCPQGHRLSCPVERAGKVGKCPKCGATFVVPSPEIAAAVGAAGGSASAPVSDSVAMAETPEEPTPAPADAAAAASANVIVFLCPNGHKLNSPASMQGKAGKCPHCGARFAIPRYEEPTPEEDYLNDDRSREEEPLDEAGVATDDDDDAMVVEESGGSGPRASELPPDFLERLTGFGAPQAAATPLVSAPPAPAPEPPLAEAFRELWQHRARGLVVQLHLRSGAVLAPDRYSAEGSADHYAIFAVKEADGTFCVSAVAWDQVERISVQGLKYLPDELFH